MKGLQLRDNSQVEICDGWCTMVKKGARMLTHGTVAGDKRYRGVMGNG
jgi:hypothetical protein